jgi:hypothetical protein
VARHRTFGQHRSPSGAGSGFEIRSGRDLDVVAREGDVKARTDLSNGARLVLTRGTSVVVNVVHVHLKTRRSREQEQA